MESRNADMVMVIAELAQSNYYNNGQNLVRVRFGEGSNEKFYDFLLINNNEFPNPEKHYVLVYTLARYLEKSDDTILPGSERLNYKPGYVSPERLANQFPYGFVWLINREVKNNTTNLNVSHMGNFNSDANLASDESLVRYSLSPSLNKPYTTKVGEHSGDVNNNNIGVFVTDNSVLLKAGGGSILIGPDGISMLGEQTSTQTTGSFGLMKKNPLGTIIPETLMTFPASIKYIPNIDYILSIGNAVNRITQAATAMGKATKVISNFRNIGL